MQKYLLLFKNNLYWAVLALYVFIQLYPKFPLLNVPGTYVAIRLEDLLIALVIGWWLFAYADRLKDLLCSTLVQTFLLFWGVGLLSLLSGAFLTHTLSLHLGIFHYLRRIETMTLFLVALYAFSSAKQLKLWLKVMLVTTVIIILYGFGQQWLSFPVISTTNKEFSKGLILFLTPDARVNSTFAGHYDLAAYLMVFLILTTIFGLYFSKLWIRIMLAISWITGFALLALTAARISFGAAILGIVSLLWFTGKKWLILVLVGFVALAFVASPELRHRTIATLTVNLLEEGGPKYTPPPQVSNPTKAFSIENAASGSATPSGVPIDIAPGEPLNTTELGVYRSYGIRLNEEWPRALRAFFKNPFLGTGYSSISIATDNDYLRMLGEVGILGVISMTLIWWLIVKKVVMFIKKSNRSLSKFLAIGLMASLLALAVNALFIDVLESSKIAELLWLLLGTTFAVTNLEEV